MTMMSRLIRTGSRHLLKTIVSKEIIKPSSSTLSHLKTYNLSVYDQFIPSTFNPIVTFYHNSNHQIQILDLKNSLSRTLTKYYPFAGRHARIAPTYVDCNDHGAEFIEASIDCELSDFLQTSRHEDLDQLFPHERIWNNDSNRSDDTVIPLAVQVNRFECGGLAVAVSLSHKVADGYSLFHFLTDWAETTRVGSEKKTHIEPHFLSFENRNLKISGLSLDVADDQCVTKSFVFPNAKINELREQMTVDATRVEVLIWLLYKCAVSAATKNSSAGSFERARIRVATNLRGKMIEPLPENSIGNFLTGMEVQTANETDPGFLIGELREQKKKIKGLRNLEAAFAPLMRISSSAGFEFEELQRKFENTYIFSSVCGFPAYGIDFGWGKPIKTTCPGNLKKNSFILMDASNMEGIEVLVCLGKQDMDVVRRDPELLPFVNNNPLSG